METARHGIFDLVYIVADARKYVPLLPRIEIPHIERIDFPEKICTQVLHHPCPHVHENPL